MNIEQVTRIIKAGNDRKKLLDACAQNSKERTPEQRKAADKLLEITRKSQA